MSNARTEESAVLSMSNRAYLDFYERLASSWIERFVEEQRAMISKVPLSNLRSNKDEQSAACNPS